MKTLNTLIVSLLLLAQPLVAAAEPLTVAVAANVKYAFDDLATEFTKQTGLEVRSVVSSSGKLTAQIKSGAPYDIFLSADMDYPATLFKDGQAMSPPKAYANGALVLWTAGNADLSKGVPGLADASIRKVAIANPKLAPYGRESIKALSFYKVQAAVEPKLVYGESISQVNQYIDTKSVEVGFTAKSVVLSPELQGKGKWVEVPDESYEPIAQGIVILRHGTENNGEAARKFYGFVFSSKAREILTKYGYKLP
ncbi:MAG: molybdate ABC transporter substrate-binding protein [Candidatus Methylopumilus sp.]|jgi:molybdate transport system substrate-binding protein